MLISLFFPFHDSDFFLCQAIELIDEPPHLSHHIEGIASQFHHEPIIVTVIPIAILLQR